ncbi:hypothetical protein Ancab_003339 [Ancistrocladus abbreviatus]
MLDLWKQQWRLAQVRFNTCSYHPKELHSIVLRFMTLLAFPIRQSRAPRDVTFQICAIFTAFSFLLPVCFIFKLGSLHHFVSSSLLNFETWHHPHYVLSMFICTAPTSES